MRAVAVVGQEAGPLALAVQVVARPVPQATPSRPPQQTTLAVVAVAAGTQQMPLRAALAAPVS